jgi:ribosomal protein L37AE/L43A
VIQDVKENREGRNLRKVRSKVRSYRPQQDQDHRGTAKAKHECPVCHHKSVKRVSSGIWLCRHCDTKFAAAAYSPNAKKELSQVSEQ